MSEKKKEPWEFYRDKLGMRFTLYCLWTKYDDMDQELAGAFDSEEALKEGFRMAYVMDCCMLKIPYDDKSVEEAVKEMLDEGFQINRARYWAEKVPLYTRKES